MKIQLGLGDLKMEDVARFCRGELYDYTKGGTADVRYVCTDSREADADTLFIATRGERVDGHDFIISALDRGCRCVLCEYVPTDIAGREAAFVVVESSVDAFALTAKGYREGAPIKTVALTGSVGKTTTKELIASILKRERRLYATEGNYNSVIGMPMSLMEVPLGCEMAVFEMGMSAMGEIRSMTNTASPDIAMVLNVGSSHLEYLKTRDNIAKAKLEIAEGLHEGGHLILNGDEPLLRKHAKKGRYTTHYIGLDRSGKCEYYAENIKVFSDHTEFDLAFGGDAFHALRINLIGKQFVYNALFAAVTAIISGISETAIREGLESYRPSAMRQSIDERNGVTVMTDCYNAAPESMRAAIDTLMALDISGKRIAVLGDMRELGVNSDRMHYEIGEYAARCGLDILLTLGRSGKHIAEGALHSGMNVNNVFAENDTDNIEALCLEADHVLQKGDAILFKASRGVRLERAIERLFGEK